MAGPVTVGIAVVDLEGRSCWTMSGTASCSSPSPTVSGWNPWYASWSVASAVGHASAGEIDDMGIIAALRPGRDTGLA